MGVKYTLQLCKKPEPFWTEHKHSNVYEVYLFLLSKPGRLLSTWRDLCVKHDGAEKPSTPSHFPFDTQTFHQENQMCFHTCTMATEITSQLRRQRPLVSRPPNPSSFLCQMNILGNHCDPEDHSSLIALLTSRMKNVSPLPTLLNTNSPA